MRKGLPAWLKKGNDRLKLRTERVPDLSRGRNAGGDDLRTSQHDRYHRSSVDPQFVATGYGNEGDMGGVQ